VAELAAAAHGFVAADVAALVDEAAMAALRRLVGRGSGRRRGATGGASPDSAGALPADFRVLAEDFRAAETRVRPSAMREVALEVPRVRWVDVGGLEGVKQRLKVQCGVLPASFETCLDLIIIEKEDGGGGGLTT
jgi:AAA family ATPase